MVLHVGDLKYGPERVVFGCSSRSMLRSSGGRTREREQTARFQKSVDGANGFSKVGVVLKALGRHDHIKRFVVERQVFCP